MKTNNLPHFSSKIEELNTAVRSRNSLREGRIGMVRISAQLNYQPGICPSEINIAFPNNQTAEVLAALRLLTDLRVEQLRNYLAEHGITTEDE